jgi:hypothetical protein
MKSPAPPPGHILEINPAKSKFKFNKTQAAQITADFSLRCFVLFSKTTWEAPNTAAVKHPGHAKV